MTTLTEGQHQGEFLISEAEGTRARATATVTSGQNLVDGQLVMLSGGKLVAHDGLLDTSGAVITAVEGIMFGNYNASSTGPKGAADWPGAVYIARDAEVNDADLTYPTETTVGGEKAACVASLKTLGIITR